MVDIWIVQIILIGIPLTYFLGWVRYVFFFNRRYPKLPRWAKVLFIMCVLIALLLELIK